MTRGLGSLLILFLLFTAAAPLSGTEQGESLLYKPYADAEFSAALHDLRRAETLFFGSLPITFAAASLSLLVIRQFTGQELDSVPLTLGITAGLSLSITVADYILGIIEED